MLAKQRGSKESPPRLCDPRETPAGLARSQVLGPLIALFVVLPTVAGDEPKVTIKGGVDPDNPQFFSWTVTNRHASPIVYVHFPQYHADTFISPTGWGQDWENRFMAGGKDAPGWVRTSVSNPAEGIPTGGSARFGMRLARAGALPRSGSVIVRFADGSKVTVANVEVPSAQSLLERNAMLVGLAAIFVIALLVHLRRRRTRTPTAASASSSTDSTQ